MNILLLLCKDTFSKSWHKFAQQTSAEYENDHDNSMHVKCLMQFGEN